MSKNRLTEISSILLVFIVLCGFVFAQDKDKKKKQKEDGVRPMTIPISIFTKQEIKAKRAEEFVEAGEIIVNEDTDDQVILSIRSVSNTPLSLAILIQDDLSSSANLQLESIKKFVRNLPTGSRVMIAYLRSGSMQVTKKFTDDLEAAAKSIRIVAGTSSLAPRSPYDGVYDTIKKFDALPTGRRAILLISDGLDASNGISSASPTQSLELDKSILRAQRNGVAVYSFYASASLTEGGDSQLISYAQGSLNRLSEETGGRAFFQGSFTAISFEPFFIDLNLLLTRQFALTYLSTHLKKGYHKVKVTSTNPEVRIEHPKGYYFR
jgi:VWFA-related protein